MAEVKNEETNPQIGSFQFALEEAKRRARAANATKELALESKPQVAESNKVGHGSAANVGKPNTNAPNANVYAGLTSGKKRKHEEVVMEKAASPAQCSDNSALTSPRLTPIDEGSKRPFAPPKKAKRAPTKYDEM